MTLTPGTKLGPYEIQSPIGAGGMGEVYRARDNRLGRDVAIKVLPAAFSQDQERLRRFEQEARAAAALNHPNILAVYDIGTYHDSPYLVTELLEGETLRQRMEARPIRVRKAIDYALQTVRGLIAAHGKGIIHRDLKPENLFVTTDGHVKILDFGLAKLTRPEGEAAPADSPTMTLQTGAGMIMGTVAYMSPEQVRGKPADARSDIFSLGAILYEMLAGKRAFHGDSPADTMSAILKEEPAPLSEMQPNIPPALLRIVDHSLEKDPADRFQSARDVAFALDAFSGSSTTTSTPVGLTKAGRRRRFARAVTAAAGAALLAFVLFFVGRQTAAPPPLPTWRQLSFQRGTIYGARFTADGENVVYAAAWDGKPSELFSMRPESTEFRSLGVTDADLLAISSGGEMAIRTGPKFFTAYQSSGMLARLMLSGAPRPIENDIQWADWSPDGKGLLIVRDVEGRQRLEYPAGKVFYETAGWISSPRFSPDGSLIAFIEHPSRLGDPGMISVTDLNGHKRDLVRGFVSAYGLAWPPSGKEVWFTATRAGAARVLYAVSLDGKERVLSRVPGTLTLEDVSKTGRVLLSRDEWRLGITALAPGQTKEQDLTYLDFSALRTLTPDGRTLLFDESGEAGGAGGVAYLRKMDGSPPVRLADTTSFSLSPDGKWVLAGNGMGQTLSQFMLIPVGTGESKTLPDMPLRIQWASWLPNRREFVFSGSERGHAARIYREAVDGGTPRPITPEGVSPTPYSQSVSPDGKSVVAVDADGSSAVYGIETGERKPIAGMEAGERAFAWSGDGESVYVYRPSIPAEIYRIELKSGRRQLWKKLAPPDPVGVYFLRAPHISADGKAYAYNYSRYFSDLYIVDGLTGR
jgi:eukaryotic-like serine/threonine-protein kinase